MKPRRLHACMVTALILGMFAGCGGGVGDGQAVKVDPEIMKSNIERAKQIQKEMEAKYKKNPGGRR